MKQLAQELFPQDHEIFLEQLNSIMERWEARILGHTGTVSFSEEDILLITYGDQFLPETPGEVPLEALRRFADEHLQGLFSHIHILPFFPATSDDGFAVSDYRTVAPGLGGWAPIEAMADHFRMAFDLVLNHTSASHPWFRAFLSREKPYDEYYHHRSAGFDASPVVRPRTHPLLTPFQRDDGSTVLVWTTFSSDQVDLNYSNPAVMLEIIDTLLYYVARGATMIRFDAIAYLWKEDGTPCIHHRNTHNTVKLFRSIVDEMGLDTVILTETNVPHRENISYFGDGRDEAHMVYNFALPPLAVHAFIDGTAKHLSRWAATLPQKSEGTTFLNFLASHDGIGVTPATGWLSDEELDHLVDSVSNRGGRVSRKSTPTGEVPYELNINLFNALAHPDDPPEQQVRTFLSAHAIMLALAGIPGVYVHSLIGSRNWSAGPDELGHNRAINRQKLPLAEVDADLRDPTTTRHAVFSGMQQLISARRANPCFSPDAAQRILDGGDEQVFALLRFCRDRIVLCLTNTSRGPRRWRSPGDWLPRGLTPGDTPRDVQDLITGRRVPIERSGTIMLGPRETVWLEHTG